MVPILGKVIWDTCRPGASIEAELRNDSVLNSSDMMPQTSSEPGGAGQTTKPMTGIEVCGTENGFAAIKKSSTDLVIWQRELPQRFQVWLDQLDAGHLPDLRILVESRNVRRAIDPLLDACGMPGCDMRDLLAEDIDDLVRSFAEITRSETVDVRLERISHDACWKFHRDNVEARLLTTYRGPTTEWVQMAYADKALIDQQDYEGPLERLGLHDVALFKGSCAGPNSGVVHRSPPVAGTGQTRLLLCLNQPTASSPDPWTKS